MYSAYKLNKQSDNIQPWRTPFPIWNQSVVSCPVLTVASWPTYRFLRWHVRWSGIPVSFRIFQFVVIHTVKGFGVVKKAKVSVFLALSLFQWPTDVDNLISGSCVFSKCSLNIWKLMVHILLKPGLENFEHYFAKHVRWVQLLGSLDILWHYLRDWNEIQSCGHCWAFQICWHTECSTFTASSFRIWNSSTGIPSPPPALFIEMLPNDVWL